MNKLYFFVGPSASGKSTVEEEFVQLGLSRVVSDTTRAIRPTEIDGIHYNFKTVKEFNSNIYANVIHITDEWLYGVSEEELQRLETLSNDSIYSVINIEPAINVSKFIKDNNINLEPVIVFFSIPSEIRIPLMKKRGETDEDIEKRLSREETLADFYKYATKPNLVVTDLYTSFETIKEFGGIS